MQARSQSDRNWCGFSVALAAIMLLPSHLDAQAPIPLGSQFQLNTFTTSDQVFWDVASVSIAPDEGFLVVWESYGSGATDNDDESIQGQRFDASGSRLGTEFQVNSAEAGRQYLLDVLHFSTAEAPRRIAHG